MNVNDFIEYLSEFPKDSKVSMIVANPSKGVRKVYPIEEFHILEKDKDNETPCFIVGVGEPQPLDEYVLEESGQLKFTQI